MVFMVLPAWRARAEDPPTSSDQLVDRLAKALRAKDQAAVLALYDWQGVPDNIKAGQELAISMMFEQEVNSIKPIPLPQDFPLEQTMAGVCYQPNVTVAGMIEIKLDQEYNPTEVKLAYGIKNQAYYLAALVPKSDPKPASKTPVPVTTNNIVAAVVTNSVVTPH
jgi:hypothetical protein